MFIDESNKPMTVRFSRNMDRYKRTAITADV